MPSKFYSDPDSDTSPIIARSDWLVVFVCFAALGLAVQARPSLAFTLPAVFLSLIYIALALIWGDRLVTNPQKIMSWGYLALQLAVFGAMSALMVKHRVFGMQWLLFMPIVSHSRILLPAWGTGLVCSLGLGIMSIHVGLLAGWSEVPELLLGVSTAVIFVLLFTDIAMREAKARAHSQDLQEELEEANQALGAYAVQAEELSAARERSRVAREIHDSVGHSLTALHMQIEAARAMLDHDPEKARESLNKAQECVQSGLAEIRHSVSALRADPLDGRGLHQALADLTDLSTNSGLPAYFSATGRQRPLPPDVALTLYRCGQEGLTNARKHSQAKKVKLFLDYGDDDLSVKLTVEDDGRGTDAAQGGFGLLGLKERAQQLGGSFHVETSPGEGLRLEIDVPTPSFSSSSEAL